MKEESTASCSIQSGAPMKMQSVLSAVAVALFIGALVLHNIFYGASIREAATRLQAEIIGVETNELCERLGMGIGSERFAACSEVLSEARRNEATRLARDVAGIL